MRWLLVLLLVLTSAEAAYAHSSFRTARAGSAWGPYVGTYSTSQGYRFRISISIPKEPSISVTLGSAGQVIVALPGRGVVLIVTNLTRGRWANVLVGAGQANSRVPGYLSVLAVWRLPPGMAVKTNSPGLVKTAASFATGKSPAHETTIRLAPRRSVVVPLAAWEDVIGLTLARSALPKLATALRAQPLYVGLQLHGGALETNAADWVGLSSSRRIRRSDSFCTPPDLSGVVVLAFTGATTRISPARVCSGLSGVP